MVCQNLDLGAVRSIINSKYCTDKRNLTPINLKLRTANNTFLPVHGSYKAALTINGCTVDHYLISADLPSDVPVLPGNDFLAKYRADISWATETLTLRIGNLVVKTNRLQSMSERKRVQGDIRGNDKLNCTKYPNPDVQTVFLCSTEPVIIAPGCCEFVEGVLTANVLPAVLSPCVVLNNMDISTIECLLTNDISVPIFNNSDESVYIPKGTKLGCVKPENQKLQSSKLTDCTLGEITYAVKNNLLVLEGIEHGPPSVDCLMTGNETDESIPSLAGADLNEDQKSKVKDLGRKYSDVFSPHMKAHAPIPNFLGHLERKNDGSIYRRQWPLSARQKEIAKKEINKFLDFGVVEKGESVVNMPFFVIEKRGSTAENPIGRCLYDCRFLNKVLVKPQLRSYTVNDILSYCSDKTLLCTLDINHYFFNIAVTEESKLLLGFTFEGRSLRWTRLPQGLSLSPQISITAQNLIMKNLPIMYYADDIIVGGKDFPSLLSVLEKVLQRLKDSNLTVNQKKATLFTKELSIIGLTVKAGEYVMPNPERFQPLVALKNPKNCQRTAIS
ncbi:Pro-Pol polyprotein [Frankliniella fusca]|uniref:Pro-Pol polyprotein n=1 Tax=Frankliniella fusca TaxID=407009 RepID=A0AAE1GUF2_9NEOP|nr:Pro-Pol polyprotein [Frankliniella fusca]